MSREPGQDRLAFRGFVAALWCIAALVVPAALHLTWPSSASLLGCAAVGAAMALGFPPLSRQRPSSGDGAPPRSSAWAAGGLHWLFGAALFAPFAATFLWLSPDGSVSVLLAGGLAALCGFAAAAGGSRASAGAGYGLITVIAASAWALGPSGPLATPGGLTLPWQAGPAAQGRGQGSVAGSLRPVALELRGPLTHESIAIHGYPALEVRAELLPGEIREARAWMVGPPSELDWPKVMVGKNVSAEPVGGGYQCPDWARRIGPPFSTDGADGYPLGALPALLTALVAAVGSIAVLRSHRLPRAGQALGLLIIGCCGAFGARHLAQADSGVGAQPQLPIAVLEGRRLSDGGTEWVESRRSFGRLRQPISTLDWASRGQFEVLDPRGAAGTRLDLALPGGFWQVDTEDPSMALDWHGPFEAGMRLLVPEVNTWGAFQAAWERTSKGEWTPLGALSLGESPNTSAVPGGAAEGPPSWWIQGLPQGESVFLGRLGLPLDGTSETWIRLSGFRAE